MTSFIDTNILIRHLTGDPPHMVERATRFLTGADELTLADLIASAERSGIGGVVSFDRSIDRVSTVTRIEPI